MGLREERRLAVGMATRVGVRRVKAMVELRHTVWRCGCEGVGVRFGEGISRCECWLMGKGVLITSVYVAVMARIRARVGMRVIVIGCLV